MGWERACGQHDGFDVSEERFEAEAYAYDLPPEMIAQEPVTPRDASRLLVLDRQTGETTHVIFRELADFLTPGDLLVLNDTRVIPARVHGRRASGGKVEVLFLRDLGEGRWETLLRCNGRLREGERIALADGAVQVRLLRRADRGAWLVASRKVDLLRTLERVGTTPLPPYIQRRENDPRAEADRERYQTIYAAHEGAVAAPTAGLHFTQEVFDSLSARGIDWTCVTLHVGAGTFRPITAADIRDHHMHAEVYDVPEPTVAAVRAARERGGRVVAVGTTSCRVLEAIAQGNGQPSAGETSIYIRPPYAFRATDALITNFHLPRSTLLVMVSAFAGRERVLAAYEECKARGYRFYSYGDAMLIL